MFAPGDTLNLGYIYVSPIFTLRFARYDSELCRGLINPEVQPDEETGKSQADRAARGRAAVISKKN